MPCCSTIIFPHQFLMQACKNFAPVPSSSSHALKSRLILSIAWKQDWATSPFSSKDCPPWASPRVTLIGTPATFVNLEDSIWFYFLHDQPWPAMSLMPAPAFFGWNSSQRTTSQPSTTSSSRTSSNRLPTSRSTFKFEPDVSTSDRLAFYTLLAIQATPARRWERPPGPSTVRQQMWPHKHSASTSLLAQVSYILDLRVPRR